MSNFRDLLNLVKNEIVETTPEDVKSVWRRGRSLRSSTCVKTTRWSRGCCRGPPIFPERISKAEWRTFCRRKDGEVVVYCAGGVEERLRGPNPAGAWLLEGVFHEWRVQPLEGPRLRLRHASGARRRSAGSVLTPSHLAGSRSVRAGQAPRVQGPFDRGGGWGRLRCSTWPPPASAPSASWTPMSSRQATFSGRWCTTPKGSACRRRNRRGRRSPSSIPTSRSSRTPFDSINRTSES